MTNPAQNNALLGLIIIGVAALLYALRRREPEPGPAIDSFDDDGEDTD